MIVVGDCREVMAGMPAESVDAIVTDPPYGLEFMGKEWDRLWRDASSETIRSAGRTAAKFKTDTPRYEAGPAAQAWHESWAREAYRVLKPGGHLLAFGGSRTYHRMACAVEDAGFEIRDQIQYLYGSGFPKSHNLKNGNGERTGWGTALKPAHEPIVVARKPLIGTVAANVERYGTGALNIDATRIGTNAGWAYPNGRGGEGWHGRESLGRNLTQPIEATSGRWPANVCLDEEAAAALDEQAGTLKSGDLKPYRQQGAGAATWIVGEQRNVKRNGDSGGASRFFQRVEQDPEELRFMYCAKASRKERERGLDGDRCVHPTVKPVALMRWLVRLVTPPGGLVLDPFAGSGTTGIACRLEGFEFMGIEQDAEYAKIAEKRIAAVEPDLFAANSA